jgi:hypothetical protein
MMSVVIAVGILAVSVLLTAVLLRLPFVRRNRVLPLVFLVNPGLVGVLASATFLTKRYLGSPVTDYLYFVSMVVIAASMIVLVFVLPKALYAPGSKSDDARDDDVL